MSHTPPGSKRPVADADDPWDRLARNVRAHVTGDFAAHDDLGDTAHLVSGRHETSHVTASYQKQEMLNLVEQSLAAAPDRGDLWMMRFEVLRTLGLKQEFLAYLTQAWKKVPVARQLDWQLLQGMWQELAPGEPLPDVLKLAGGVEAARPVAVATPSGTPRIRRFADIAARIAERELAVLAKAYAALSQRPGFLEDFARKAMPLLKRPTPLQLAERLSKAGGDPVRVFLKREDRRATTAELDHAAAQCYIAGLLGRTSVVTANDVDAHSLAVAEMAPHFKLKVTVVVKPEDLEGKPELIAQLRAREVQVEPMPEAGMLGTDPREGAVRLWQKSAGGTHLVLSLGTAPAPYPAMASAFRALLGHETALQLRALAGTERPRTWVAALSSEADSLGFMLPQLGRKESELIYAEPEPGGVASWRASQRLRAYNGAIREHTLLYGTGRIEHVALGDATAAQVREQLARDDGITISHEDARAVALTQLLTQRDRNPRDFVVLVA